MLRTNHEVFKSDLNDHDLNDLNRKFKESSPVPWLVVPEFLNPEMVISMKGELDYEYRNNYDSHKLFTRAGSHMFEILDNHKYDYAYKLISEVHSKPFIDFLESITGVRGLICDPSLVGAGYMRCGKGDSLKIHTDFNWNDQLYLHRVLSVIFYLNPECDESWNGDLQLWDKERKNKEVSIFPSNGNMLIWQYDKLGYHGHPNPLDCPEGYFRDGFRFFFYVSSSEYQKDDLPHRSLYFYDESIGEPSDKESSK